VAASEQHILVVGVIQIGHVLSAAAACRCHVSR
jgi:hypothetical protein